MTLDNAQDAFRYNLTAAAAQAYLDTAIEYWMDEMIGDDAFNEAKRELAQWCDYFDSTLTDPRTLAVWSAQ